MTSTTTRSMRGPPRARLRGRPGGGSGDERGFTLLEVFVAGTVLVVTLLGLALLTMVAARNTRQGTMETAAAQLATRLVNEYQARTAQGIKDETVRLGTNTIFNNQDIRFDVFDQEKQMRSSRRLRATVVATRGPAEVPSTNCYRLDVRVEWVDETRLGQGIAEDTALGVYHTKQIHQVAYVSQNAPIL